MDFAVIAGCFARALAFAHVAPMLSEEHVGERTRLAFAAVLALVLAPAGAVVARDSIIIELMLEVAAGVALGLAVALPWSTVSALLPQLVSSTGLEAEDDGEPPAARLATAVSLACFLALSGERFLVTLLAAPAKLPGATGLADLAVAAGSAVFTLAAVALVPFLAVLAAARVVGALVLRAAAVDLSPFHAPALALAGMVLVLAYLQAAPMFHEDALHEAATAARSLQ